MKSALLVIDVQKGLFTPPPADAEATIDRINTLSAAARQAGAANTRTTPGVEPA